MKYNKNQMNKPSKTATNKFKLLQQQRQQFIKMGTVVKGQRDNPDC